MMKRMTRYSEEFDKYETSRENAYYDEKDNGELTTCGPAIETLGEYENLSCRLGIDLRILARLIFSVVFYEKLDMYELPEDDIVSHMTDDYQIDVYGLRYLSSNPPVFYWRDYGKTWALTKEELE